MGHPVFNFAQDDISIKLRTIYSALSFCCSARMAWTMEVIRSSSVRPGARVQPLKVSVSSGCLAQVSSRPCASATVKFNAILEGAAAGTGLRLPAKADLLSIGAYTLETWGTAQAERYLDGLERCAKVLAANPPLGRPCKWIRAGLYRFEKGRHVLYYRNVVDGIFISRIPHQNMLPEQQPFEDT